MFIIVLILASFAAKREFERTERISQNDFFIINKFSMTNQIDNLKNYNYLSQYCFNKGAYGVASVCNLFISICEYIYIYICDLILFIGFWFYSFYFIFV